MCTGTYIDVHEYIYACIYVRIRTYKNNISTIKTLTAWSMNSNKCTLSMSQNGWGAAYSDWLGPHMRKQHSNNLIQEGQ